VDPTQTVIDWLVRHNMTEVAALAMIWFKAVSPKLNDIVLALNGIKEELHIHKALTSVKLEEHEKRIHTLEAHKHKE
jgi:uncharacterized membrane protein YfbV (UPF0208 family)